MSIKKIKLLFIIFFLFLLSGCQMNYTIKVNEDLSTSETIDFRISSDTMEESKVLYGEDYSQDLIDKYMSQIEEYNCNIDKSDGFVLYGTKENKRFEINEKIIQSKYKFYDFSCNDTYCLLYAVPRTDVLIGNGAVYNLKLSFQIPYRVINSNADEIDKLNNTYSWNFVLGKENKDVLLIFKKNGNDVVKTNKIFYFIILGIFAIIALGSIYIIVNFIIRVRTGGRPR